MDPQVKIAQTHLNSTYGHKAGWTRLTEDGVAGWNTIYGLRKALQVELGIAQLATGFGDKTRSAFIEQLGVIAEHQDTPMKVLRIVNWSLWCKGQSGVYDDPASPVTFAFIDIARAITNLQGALGLTINSSVDVKLMAFLLSMDSHVLARPGRSAVRQIQQWLNGTFANRRDFEIVACDGVVTRNTQKALLLAFQYELGMADGVANGNFGPGTRDGLRGVRLAPGAIDGSKRYVHLLKVCLVFNEIDVPWSGTYDESTQTKVTSFQAFMELPVSATVEYGTWCALLVSSGDPDRPTIGIDTNEQMGSNKYRDLANKGYTHVGRYLTNAGAFLSLAEIEAFGRYGLNLLPIFQRRNDLAEHMTYDNGYDQGTDAIVRAREIGLPANSVIYAAADADFVGEVVERNVMEYYRGFKDAISVHAYGFTLGAYAPRLVCRALIDRLYSTNLFVSASSVGYSGNIGVPMPARWDYMQIAVDKRMLLDGQGTAYDSVVVSSGAPQLRGANIAGAPPHRYGDRTSTGIDSVFAWMVRAEVFVQRSLEGELSRWSPGGGLRVMCNFLRLDHYNDATWTAYFAPMFVNVVTVPTSAEYHLAAGLLSQRSKPVSGYDWPHFAATTLGYLLWGVPVPHVGNISFVGDLGGWLLDLLSMFSEIDPEATTSAVEEYVFANVGSAGGSFGWRDLLADVDAYLVAFHTPTADANAVAVDWLRKVWLPSPARRVADFYEIAFVSSATSVENYLRRFYWAADSSVPGLDISPRNLVMAAGGMDFWPSEDQVVAAGRGFARALERASNDAEWDWK